MKQNKIPLKDIKFVNFRAGKGPGGQNVNKTETSVRATHIPTGITVESTKERTQGKNKQAAIENLQAKLDSIEAEKLAREREAAYTAKPESSFASQIRTYRLCGKTQGVTDHRTGITHSNTKAVLEGDIDNFLKGKINE